MAEYRMQITQQSNKLGIRLRNRTLIHRMERGELTFDAANRQSIDEGWGPLLFEPRSEVFVPLAMAEQHWTAAMAVARMAWGDMSGVLRCFDRYSRAAERVVEVQIPADDPQLVAEQPDDEPADQWLRRLIVGDRLSPEPLLGDLMRGRSPPPTKPAHRIIRPAPPTIQSMLDNEKAKRPPIDGLPAPAMKIRAALARLEDWLRTKPRRAFATIHRTGAGHWIEPEDFGRLHFAEFLNDDREKVDVLKDKKEATIYREVMIPRVAFLKWIDTGMPAEEPGEDHPAENPSAPAGEVERLKTGAPGKPSGMYLVEREYRRRALIPADQRTLADELPTDQRSGKVIRARTAAILSAWFALTHKEWPPLDENTIRQRIPGWN